MGIKMNWVIENYGAYHAVLGSQGDRASMEDNYAIYSSLPGVSLPNIFAVFDGHGGPDCATYCRDALPQILSRHPELKSDPKRAIIESFLEVDQQYCRLASSSRPLDDGTTATLLYVQPTFADNSIKKRKSTDKVKLKFYLAACGDSRAILVKKDGSVVPLSNDHDLKRRDEAERIKRAGGRIRHDDYGSRVVSEHVGELAVTRAIGDVDFKSIGVTAEPEIYEGFLTSDDAFVIIASDGLWNQVSNEECGKLVTSTKDFPKNAKLSTKLERLIKIAKKRDNKISEKFHDELSCDNITVLGVNTAKLLHKLPPKCDAVLQYQKRRKKTLVIKGFSPHGYVSELLLWKNPLRSFFWVLVGVLFYFLVEIASYNFITLVSLLILSQLVVDTVVVNFTPLLLKLNLVGVEFDAHVFLNEGTFITDEVVDRGVSLVGSEYSRFESNWKTLIFSASPEKLLVVLRNISYCFTPFSVSTLLFIIFLSSFSLFVTYERNKTLLDKYHQKLLIVYYRTLQAVKFKKRNN